MSDQHLRVAHSVIDDVLPIVGETAFVVYLYLGRHARWANDPSKLGTELIQRGELVRTVDQIAIATGIHASSVKRAVSTLERLGMVETRPLGNTRVVRLTEFLVHFQPNSEPNPDQDRTKAEPKPDQSRTKTGPLTNNNYSNSISYSDSTPKRVRSPRRTPTLLPLESYKEIIIPNWKIIPATPITPPKHELAPPNAVCGTEAPLPIPRGDWLVPNPGFVMKAVDVYEAIFWVFPREWDAYTDRGGGFPDDTTEWLKLEAWAVANREKFFTNKRYSNHTAWLKARLGERTNGNYGSRAAYN